LNFQSEPFDEVATYRGDIVVGLKYIPPENIKSSFFSRGSSITGSSSNLRKFGGSIKSVTSKSDRTSKGGQLHVLVKEAKHLSPIKANGTCDAFCKRWVLNFNLITIYLTNFDFNSLVIYCPIAREAPSKRRRL